jgi:ABC-type uncharacterized transport system involved in gliding motility auxiliary subunit
MNAASLVKQVLTDQQHDVQTVNLMGKERKVPDGCSVLVIAGPQVEFRPEELKAVRAYLDTGGKALILLRGGGPGLQDLLKDYGLKVGDNVVMQLVDYLGSLAVSRTVRVTKFETHDINRNLSAVELPLCRTLNAVSPAPAGVTTTPLIKTDADTVAKPLKPGQTRLDPRPAPGDPHGPFTLAMEAEKPVGDKKSKVVVIGSSEWATDRAAGDPVTSNRYLLTNAVNWLADEDVLVDIPPKDEPPDQLTMTPEQRIRSLYINVLLFPVVCLFMAVFVWWRRR